jgi:hypothetical protein
MRFECYARLVRRLLLLVAVLAGCGSGDGSTPDASTDAPSDAVSADQVAPDAADGAVPTPTTIATSVGYPYCLAADATNVYYCSGSDVFMVPIAGGSPTKLAANPNQANTWALAPGSNVLYVLDPSAGYIGSIPLPGGGWTWLEKSLVLTPGRGLVLSGSNVYWVAQLAGNVMQVDVNSGTPTAVATGQTSPAEIVGDSTDLYWINQNSQTGAVMGMALPSGTPTQLVTAKSAQRIALDATNVYYIAAGASYPAVFEVPRAGGTPTEILGKATGLALGEAPTAIAAGGGAVYASTNLRNIYKIGSSATLVATETNYVPEILADANNLYWITGDPVNGAVIKKVPRP